MALVESFPFIALDGWLCAYHRWVYDGDPHGLLPKDAPYSDICDVRALLSIARSGQLNAKTLTVYTL